MINAKQRNVCKNIDISFTKQDIQKIKGFKLQAGVQNREGRFETICDHNKIIIPPHQISKGFL